MDEGVILWKIFKHAWWQGVGMWRRERLNRESMESNLRHGYQASLLGLFFHVTLTPNSLLPSYKSNRLSYPCIPCTPSIPLYTQYTPAYPVYPCTCIDLPDITRYVLKTFIWHLEMSSSYIMPPWNLKNILNEFERHHNHTRPVHWALCSNRVNNVWMLRLNCGKQCAYWPLLVALI